MQFHVVLVAIHKIKQGDLVESDMSRCSRVRLQNFQAKGKASANVWRQRQAWQLEEEAG